MFGIFVIFLWFYGFRFNYVNFYELGLCLFRVFGVIDIFVVVRWFEWNLYLNDVGIVNVGFEFFNFF